MLHPLFQHPDQPHWRFNETERAGDNGNGSSAGGRRGDELCSLPPRPITIKICHSLPLIEKDVRPPPAALCRPSEQHQPTQSTLNWPQSHSEGNVCSIVHSQVQVGSRLGAYRSGVSCEQLTFFYLLISGYLSFYVGNIIICRSLFATSQPTFQTNYLWVEKRGHRIMATSWVQ